MLQGICSYPWVHGQASTNLHSDEQCWQFRCVLLRIYPESFTVMGTIKAGFLQKFKVPNIIGCIGCTHGMIQAPPNNLHPEETILPHLCASNIRQQLRCGGRGCFVAW